MEIAEQYTYCMLEVNENTQYCQIVNLVGKMPKQQAWVYDISYIIFYVCLIAVIFSPIYFLYRIIRGVKHE